MPPLIDVRPANERGVSTKLVAELLGCGGVADLRPVDHDVLGAGAGPLDECHADVAVAARADGIEHARIGDRCGIAVALQLEFGVVDAARYVGGEHQQEIDVVSRACLTGRQKPARQAAAKIAVRSTLIAVMIAV